MVSGLKILATKNVEVSPTCEERTRSRLNVRCYCPESLHFARPYAAKRKSWRQFGVLTIVELITEEEPFDGYNQHQLRKAVLAGERPSLKSADVPMDLETLLSTCMSEAASKRPSADCFLASYLKAKDQLF